MRQQRNKIHKIHKKHKIQQDTRDNIDNIENIDTKDNCYRMIDDNAFSRLEGAKSMHICFSYL